MLPDNHFRLVTLGRLTLLGAAGEEDASLARRRFKLALLTVLAMARRPVTRDALLEMFWGEQDEARARHSLSNALSSLRRALGQRAVTTRDADVALTNVSLAVDALELAEAAEARDAARVVELYRGPFLDGVYVDESPAFDQWVFRERRRLEAIFLAACARQCETLARARRWSDCRALATRWLDTEPLSANAPLFLLNAIKAAGTRAALADALDEYERLRTRLDREFDLQPEQCVRELAARIREQLATLDPEPVNEPAPETEGPPAPQAVAAARAIPADGAAARPDLAPPRPRRPRWRVASLGSTAALALLLAANGPIEAGRAAVAGRVNRPVIAVLDMDVSRSDSAVAWLGDGLPQMITQKLGHNAAVEIVDPARARAVVARRGLTKPQPLDDAAARDVARRVGATLVAHGAIARDGSNLILELTIRDVESGNLVRSDVLTCSNALELASEAASRILGAANVIVPGPHMAGLETSNLEAYQHYIRALEVGRAGQGTEQKREIDAAIALDSGFIASVRMRLQIAVLESDTAVGRRLRETLKRYANRATEFDQLEQEASDAFYAGDRERSEALARDLLRRYPRDPRAYRLLQDFLASHGEVERAEAVAIQGLALDSLAMEAGNGPCALCNGFYDIVRYHWMRRDFRGAAEWSQRWVRTQPDGATAWATLAWTMVYAQQPDSALPLMQRAVSLSGADVWAATEYARVLVVARAYDAADSAIAVMESSTEPARRAQAFDLRSLLERERGRYRASSAVVERFRTEVPTSAGFADMIRADNQRILGQHAGAARGYEVLVHSPAERNLQLPLPSTAARAFCWHHALVADVYAETGDTIMLRAMADTLERGCTRSFYGRDWRLYHHARGLVAMRAGRYDEAERELTQAIWSSVEGWSRTTVHLADAQRALGRPDDAIATLRTAYSTRLNAMGRYVPVSELDYRMAQAFAHAGELDSARTYAGYVRSAWREADPEIRRLLERLP